MKLIAFLLAVLAIVFVVHVGLTVRTTRNREAELRSFFENPPLDGIEVLRVTPEKGVPLGHIVTGQFVEHLVPVQLYVDTGGQLEYWKPPYGIQGEALWATDTSPADACDAMVAELGLDGSTCINKLADCLEGVKQAGLKNNDCSDLYEGGYFLVPQASSARLGAHTLGMMRFKRGVYVSFNYSRAETPPRHRIGEPGDTVIQVTAEQV